MKLPSQAKVQLRRTASQSTRLFQRALVSVMALPVKRSAPQMTVRISPSGKTAANTNLPMDPH